MLKLRRWTLLTLLLVVLMRPTSAVAAPITITFAGEWFFFDQGSPLLNLDLVAALAAYGVIGGGGPQNLVGTPVSFSMVVDPSVPLGASNFFGTGHPGAFLGGILEVGRLSFQFGPGDFDPLGIRTSEPTVSGPSVSANGVVFTPVFGFWRMSGFQTTSFATTFANIGSWPVSTAFISFHNPSTGAGTQGDIGLGSGLRVVSVSVPEPSSLIILAPSVVALAFARRRRKGRDGIPDTQSKG